jgi:hypothetical protein
MPITINVMTARMRATEYARKWRAANLEKSRMSSRRWKAANFNRVMENLRLWERNNPDKTSLHRRRNTSKARARKFGCNEHYTIAQWLSLKAFYENRCLSCGRSEKQLLSEGLKLVPDHVKALADGGSDTIDNIQPLCNGVGGCNGRKYTKHIDYRTKGLNVCQAHP